MSAPTKFFSPPMKVPAFVRAMMRFQTFLLRHNCLGSLGDFVMVITVQGRRTGKRYSTPIAYLRDGDTILAVNPGGRSNWFRNALANPLVTLEIRGRRYRACAEHVACPKERARIFELYRADGRVFRRLFGVDPDTREERLADARDSREFVRFHLIE